MTTVIAAMGIASTAQGFDLQGHRGARGLMPENTLPGFAMALSIGVNTLELDVGITRDGHVVVIHNPHLEPELARTADGKWIAGQGPAIYSLTLAQIKSYDVGRLNPDTGYAGRYPGQIPVDGATVPTLAEVFDLVIRSGNNDVRFNIESKLDPRFPDLSPPPDAFAGAVLKIVQQYRMQKRVILQSFDWRMLQEVQRLAPEITTSYLTASQSWLDNLQIDQPGPSPWLAGYDVDQYGASVPRAIKAAGGRIWSSYYPELTAEGVKEAHELGLSVKVWTVNDPVDMGALIDMGVDGIITDYPDVLRDLLINRKIAVPAPTPVTP